MADNKLFIAKARQNKAKCQKVAGAFSDKKGKKRALDTNVYLCACGFVCLCACVFLQSFVCRQFVRAGPTFRDSSVTPVCLCVFLHSSFVHVCSLRSYILRLTRHTFVSVRAPSFVRSSTVCWRRSCIFPTHPSFQSFRGISAPRPVGVSRERRRGQGRCFNVQCVQIWCTRASWTTI